MASITWFVQNTLASVHQEMNDVSPGANATTSPAYGWTVGTVAVGNFSKANSQVKQATTTFALTPVEPDGSIDIVVGDCWRTTARQSGNFDTGTWEFDARVIAVSSGGDQSGRAGFRLFKGVAVDGSDAVEITTARLVGTTVTSLTTTTSRVSTATATISAFHASDEFIFIQVGWEITGAGAKSTRDVVFQIGDTASRIISANFTQDVDSIATQQWSHQSLGNLTTRSSAKTRNAALTTNRLSWWQWPDQTVEAPPPPPDDLPSTEYWSHRPLSWNLAADKSYARRALLNEAISWWQWPIFDDTGDVFSNEIGNIDFNRWYLHQNWRQKPKASKASASWWQWGSIDAIGDIFSDEIGNIDFERWFLKRNWRKPYQRLRGPNQWNSPDDIGDIFSDEIGNIDFSQWYLKQNWIHPYTRLRGPNEWHDQTVEVVAGPPDDVYDIYWPYERNWRTAQATAARHASLQARYSWNFQTGDFIAPPVVTTTKKRLAPILKIGF